LNVLLGALLSDDDNKPLPEEKASEQRALMFELCGEERLKVETELKQKKELLELHIQSRKRTGVKLTKGDEDVCMHLPENELFCICMRQRATLLCAL